MWGLLKVDMNVRQVCIRKRDIMFHLCDSISTPQKISVSMKISRYRLICLLIHVGQQRKYFLKFSRQSF